MSLAAHSHCDRRVFSARTYREEVNLYEDWTVGFHITFFEIMPSWESHHPKFKERGTWKQGPVYGQWDEDRLCESSFTVQAPRELGNRLTKT